MPDRPLDRDEGERAQPSPQRVGACLERAPHGLHQAMLHGPPVEGLGCREHALDEETALGRLEIPHQAQGPGDGIGRLALDAGAADGLDLLEGVAPRAEGRCVSIAEDLGCLRSDHQHPQVQGVALEKVPRGPKPQDQVGDLGRHDLEDRELWRRPSASSATGASSRCSSAAVAAAPALVSAAVWRKCHSTEARSRTNPSRKRCRARSRATSGGSSEVEAEEQSLLQEPGRARRGRGT